MPLLERRVKLDFVALMVEAEALTLAQFKQELQEEKKKADEKMAKLEAKIARLK